MTRAAITRIQRVLRSIHSPEVVLRNRLPLVRKLKNVECCILGYGSAGVEICTGTPNMLFRRLINTNATFILISGNTFTRISKLQVIIKTKSYGYLN